MAELLSLGLLRVILFSLLGIFVLVFALFVSFLLFFCSGLVFCLVFGLLSISNALYFALIVLFLINITLAYQKKNSKTPIFVLDWSTKFF